MEGKHITNQHQHEQHSAGMEETHHKKDHHGGWVCHRCGWTHHNPHPSAKQRRSHRKHCGKIEGFKLSSAAERETQGGSSDEVSSDDEHKPTEHTKTEGKPIREHQHPHEQQQQQPAGMEQTHHTTEHHGWVCHRCGWTYHNRHPNAKHRRNHKKHCGKIEGFKLIRPGDEETQGGSSDEVSSDDDYKSTDQEKLTSLEENNFVPQTHASASTSAQSFSNLDMSSNDADVGKTFRKLGVSDNSTLEASEIAVPHAKARNLSSHDESGKGVSEETLATTVGLGVHGLNVSGTIEPSNNSALPNILNSTVKSSSFVKEVTDTDSSQDARAYVNHQELTVKGHHKELDPHELKQQNNQTDNKVLSVPEDSIPLVVQAHQGSADVVDGLGSQIKNETIKQHLKVSEEQQDISQDVKRSFAKLQNPVHIEPPMSFGKSALTPTHAAKEQNLGMSSRRVGIASILSFNGLIADNLNANFSSVEESTTSADKKIYEPSQINHQVYDSEKKQVLFSETKEQEMGHDVSIPSDLNEGFSTRSLLGADSQKEHLQSLASEPETEKLPQLAPCAISSESTSANVLSFEVIEGANVIHSQEKMIPVEESVSNKSKDNVESKNNSSIAGVLNSFTEEEKPSDFKNTNSDDVLHPEIDNKLVSIVACALPEQKAAKKTECHCSGNIEKTSDQQQASKVVIPDGKTSGADGPAEYSKSGERQQAECSAFTDLSIIEHDSASCDPESKKEDSTEQNITLSDVNMASYSEANPLALENLPKTPVRKVEVDDKSAVSESHQPQSMLYSHEEKSETEQDTFVKPGDYIESKNMSPTCGDSDGNRDEEKHSNFDNSNSHYMLHPEEDKKKIIEIDFSKQGAVEKTEHPCTTSDQKLDAQASGMVPLQAGDRQQAECSVVTKSSIVDINSAVQESQQPEFAVYSHENKNIVEQAVFVKPHDVIEPKDISPICGDPDSPRDEEKHPHSNLTNGDDKLHSEKDKKMIIGTGLCEQVAVKKTMELSSEGIETTFRQKTDAQTSSDLVIPNPNMSLADNTTVGLSKSGETNEAEWNGCKNSSITEHYVKGCEPDCKSEDLMPGNIVLPGANTDEHSDAITARENFPIALAKEVVDQSSPTSESVQSNARETHASFHGVDHAKSETQLPREESQCECNEKKLEHSVGELNVTSCSATTATVDNSLPLDNHGNSSRESPDDVSGNKNELKTSKPALWEQLLETNAKESIIQETYQDLGDAGSSPGNPFIHEHKLSSNEEPHQLISIQGSQGSIFEPNNKISTADMFEAPSFVTLVESGKHSERLPSHAEIQPKSDIEQGASQDNQLSTDAAEMEPGRPERPHTPLRNLLEKENMRGTQDRSKEDSPVPIEQLQTSSQNNIEGVHASFVEVTSQAGTSSQKLALSQKDNSSSKKMVEKVWNSPARLPSPKGEKQKVKVRSAWSMCLCGSAAN